MAARKKSDPRIKSTGARAKSPSDKYTLDTIESLLRTINSRYTFGPAFNKRIENALDRAVATRLLDPLHNQPRIFDPGHNYDTPRVFTSAHSDERVALGFVHGYPAKIRHTRDGRVQFVWGCATERSEEEARRHWNGGKSRLSLAERPHSDELIRHVKAICEFRGWTW